MNGERFFVDTVFVQALLNRRDQYHRRAVVFAPRLASAAEIWITEAVLIEIADALSKANRAGAAGFIRRCYLTRNTHVVSVDTALLGRATNLYEARGDKG